MCLLIMLLALLLLLVFTIGPAWAWDDPPSSINQFSSITILPVAPNVTVYQAPAPFGLTRAREARGPGLNLLPRPSYLPPLKIFR